jgi:hypothetical protein
MATLSRRTLLAGLAALATSPGRAQVAAFPQVATFSSVAVDASVLRTTGQGPAADLVEAVMTDELRRVFAGRIGGRGPRLVVQVTQLYLTGFPRSASDSMDGAALIVGPRGEVQAAYPLFTTLIAAGSSRDAPENEPRRVAAIARNYAQWLVRKIG